MEVNIESTQSPDAYAKPRPESYPEKSEDKCCHVITVNKSPAEVYAFCENHENFDALIQKMENEFKCNLRIVKNKTKRTIAWYSTEDSDVKTTGNVWFDQAPQKLGTVATVVMDYSMLGKRLVEIVAKLKGEDIDSLILSNIRRVKCFLETGEVATTDGQSSGRDEDQEKIIQ